MRINIDDIWSEDIIDYLRIKEFIPKDKNSSHYDLDDEVFEDVSYQVEERIREELSLSSIVSNTLEGVLEDYFCDKEVRTTTQISVVKIQQQK